MRYIALVGVLAFTFTAGECYAIEYDEPGNTALQAVEAAHDTEKDADVSDINDDDKDAPVTQVGVMPAGQSYDDNTGMPDVVSSDSDTEFE